MPSLISTNYGAVIAIRTMQGAASGVIYSLLGPMCQKHTFHFYLSATVSVTITFFRLGMSSPLLIAGEFCKSGDFTSGFFIAAGATIFACGLWLIVIRLDAGRRRKIELQIPAEKSEPGKFQEIFFLFKFFLNFFSL